jgi:hypothetical protein
MKYSKSLNRIFGKQFVSGKFMRRLYSDSYFINIDKEIYELQVVDKQEETFFLLKQSEKVVSTITMNEEGQWQSDNHISENELKEVVRWIENLFM